MSRHTLTLNNRNSIFEMQNLGNKSVVETYIESQTEPGKARLRQIQNIARSSVPQAVEEMIFGMPTFTLNNKHLLHFASGEKHTVLYPGTETIDHFWEQLFSYSPSKEAIHFPLRFALPVDLIEKIIRFRLKQIQ